MVLSVGLAIASAVIANQPQGDNAVIDDEEEYSLKNAQDKFNLYANYFLYGEDSGNDIVESPDETTAYLNESLSTWAIEPQLLEQSLVNYERFYNIYNGLETKDTIVANILTDYLDKLKLITLYYQGDILTRTEIAASYINDGEDGARGMIYERLAPYSELGELYGLDYYGLIESWALGTLSLIQHYDEMGCLDGEEVDYMCAAEKVTDETSAISAEISANYTYMQTILENSRDYLYTGIFDIKEILDAEERIVEEGDEEAEDE